MPKWGLYPAFLRLKQTFSFSKAIPSVGAVKPCPEFLAPISGAKPFPTNPVFSQFKRDNRTSLFVWRKTCSSFLDSSSGLHLITHIGLTPQMPLPSTVNTLEHFPTLRMSPTLEQKSGDHAFTHVPSWKPALRSLLPPPPACLSQQGSGTWMPTELLLPKQTFCLLESEQERGHLDRHVRTALLTKELAFQVS